MAGQKLNIGTRHLHVCVSPQGPFAQPPNGLTSPSTNTIQLTLFSFSSLPLTKPRGAGGAINLAPLAPASLGIALMELESAEAPPKRV